MTSAARPIGLAPGAERAAAGQDARKYGTTNPVVQRLLRRWTERLRDVLGHVDGVVLDVGVGEGLALERMVPDGQPVVGVEYREDKVALARGRCSGLHPVVADAGMLPLVDGAVGTVTCIEVLEHLTDPPAAVRELARVSSHRAVVSVPWEPWFRLGNLGRGKNVSRLGNDPEHVQAFAPGSLRTLLLAQFEQVRVVRCFPWLIAEASRPRSGAGSAHR